MKVLETTPSQTFTMGKKKHKFRNTKSSAADNDQSESSEDTAAVAGATGHTCSHINKAVNLAAMRKAIQKQIFGECTSCAKDALSGKKKEKSSSSTTPTDGDPVPTSSSTDELFSEETDPIIWVCLQCGHQGCDRNSQEKHSLLHFETPHSSSHVIVINTTSWAAWCYECDDEVLIEGSKRLKECADFLRKTAGLTVDNPSQSGRRGQTGGTGDSDQLSSGKGRVGTGRTGTGQTAAALCQKVKGLSNLGNTCFFNAVMQVLCQTLSLESLIGERGKKGCVLTVPGRSVENEADQWNSTSSNSSDEEFKDIDVDKNLTSIDVVLPELGSLTQAVLSFLHEMNNTSGKSGTVSPNMLFGQVCKKAPRFRGYQQQDSHELLRYLLDNMKTEEIKRGRSGILKYFKLSENANPKKIDICTRMRVKEYGRQTKLTFVDRVFGGQLISTVVCNECGYASQIFEPFLDLSLSITEEKPHRPNLGVLGKKQPSPEGVASVPKPSKQLERKMKKQARRDAKRKQKTAKNKVVPLSEFRSEGGNEEEGGSTMQSSTEDVGKNSAGKDTENGDLSQDSDIEDTSDADVEDNLETDSLRNPTLNGTPSPVFDSSSKDFCQNSGSIVNSQSVSETENQISNVTKHLSGLNIDEPSKPDTGSVKTANGDVQPLVNGIETSSQSEKELKPTETESPNGSAAVNGRSKEDLKREARQKSMVTLGPRYQPLPRECSVLSSLHHFTSAELLTGNNKFGCEKCTKKLKAEKGKSELVKRNASKHYLIFSPPAVLTLHFKRFEQIGFNSRKVNSHVDFPFLLDISSFCSSLCQGRRKDQKRILYALYGVVEHSGRLSGGHYTAYVKVRPNVGLLMDFLQTYASHPRELIQQYSENFVNGVAETGESSSDTGEVPVPPGRWFHISDNRVSEVQETTVQIAQAYLLFYERIC